jgi:outer membrane protein W
MKEAQSREVGMKLLRVVTAASMTTLVFSSILFAQQSPMRGRSCVEVQFGLWNESKAGNELSPTGVTSGAKSSGFLGGLAYTYWLRDRIALSVATGLIAGEATSTASLLGPTGQRASSVMPILVGMRYDLLEPEPGDAVRPYVAAAVGSFLGFEASNTLFSQSAHSESAFGGRAGVGVDFFAASWLKLDVNLGYNAMTDFRTPVGARSNYSGPDFSIGFGYVFGGMKSD